MSLPTSPSLLWIDKCPCFSCPYGYDDRCERMQQSIPCTLIQEWVLDTDLKPNSNSSNKKDKTYGTIRKESYGRWKLHSKSAGHQGW